LVLALAVIAGHLTVVAGFGHWWGGHCFGARLTAGLVPWIVVLAIIGLDAWRVSSANGDRHFSESVLFALVGALSGLSVGINSVAAFSNEAQNWNVSPNIDETPARLWSWRRPQFLAPLFGTGASPPATDSRSPPK
jgi:hypothetical protein